MEEIRKFAHRGGHVIGNLHGFQILLRRGICPARCAGTTRQVRLPRRAPQVENAMTPWTRKYKGDVIPHSHRHGDGNYYLDPEGLRRRKAKGRRIPLRRPGGIRGVRA